MTRNYVLRRLRRERSFVSIDDTLGDTIATENASVNEALARNESIQAMRRAVLNLPPHYREVVVLCDLQELSYAEAAAVLDSKIGTGRSRLHRARGLLIERLRPTSDETAAEKEIESARCFA